MRTYLSNHASWAALGLALAIAAPAAAQSGDNEISELVVTAQRVEENVQKVPIAVTAFSAAALERQSVETLQDIAIKTPGFSAGQVDPIQTNFAIRGIGSAFGISQNAGGDASVVVFVDGVYAGRGGTPDIDALNLERVEVLRGPQGTLFGKNAVGGLIQFVSRKPSADPSLRIEGQLGNYDRRTLSARGNMPISDKIFVSLGGSIKLRDGYEFNQTTGNDVNDQDLRSAALAVRFLPSEDLDIVLGVDLTDQDQKGNPRDNICDATLRGGVHCVGINPDPRIVNAYTDGYLRRWLQTYRGEVNWTTPYGTLTSITAFRAVTLNFRTVFFANPVNPPNQIESTQTDHEDNEQFSQEVRLAFDAFDSRLRGQVGVYYLNEDNTRIEDLRQDFPAPAQTGIATYPQMVKSRSWALFGQVSYAFTDTITATAGLRQTWERKSGRFIGQKVSGPGLPPPLAANYDVRGRKSWDALTPRFALDWQATPDVLLYASATRGFKSGGFQGIAGSGVSQSTPYDPEFAWSYEGGAKTQWLDGRLRLNLSAFHTDYKDLQVSQLVPLCCVVVGNAATAEIEGVELEWVIQPVRGLQIDGGFAYLDAKFTSFANGATANFTGNDLPRSPKHKVHVGAQYATEFNGWGALARVDYTNQSHMYFEASNIPAQKQEGYINVDARLSLTSPDKRWEVAVWGKNLTDELVATYVTAFAPYRQVLVPYAPPKTYGVTLVWKM
ncbi:MAG: TonB-dependent receptor [Phenylobacterium sp.]|uniref:TonB-dependent receptor n=1 Tax=Phenylobacterium sp. TaxID=1871053 RepID=UPI001A41AF31|nr:TonB-dependent receptor [Phenylobacterium sp.]MBL8771582.1 TonB-dependent receptor [Phenylobacterium sp.]